MENNTYRLIRPSTSSNKTFVAIFAGIAILGFVAFVALNNDTQSLRGSALYDIEEIVERDHEFEKFITKFKKFYLSTQERELRKQIFYENFDYVQRTNSNSSLTYKVGINKYADLSLNEFKILKLGLKVPEKRTLRLYSKKTNKQVEEAADFTDTLPGVKDQGSCGSCWAFSAIAATEGQYYRVNQEVISLSEQELVDCTNNDVYENNGCGGGWMDKAFQYIQDHGIHFEVEYPYIGVDQECYAEGDTALIGQGFTDIPANDNVELLKAAAEQPISVAVNAGSQGWQLYQSGIINSDCGTELDHGVAVVGYNTENGVDYWIVRNSWGVGWGEDGYVRILRTSEEGPGMCGIAMVASYPVLE